MLPTGYQALEFDFLKKSVGLHLFEVFRLNIIFRAFSKLCFQFCDAFSFLFNLNGKIDFLKFHTIEVGESL